MTHELEQPYTPPGAAPASPLRYLRVGWRIVKGLVIATLVIVHTAAIIVGCADPLLKNDPLGDFDDYANHLMTATGTAQRWNMFSPNVGNSSATPVLLIVFKDGRRTLVHSPAEPLSTTLTVEDYLSKDLAADKRTLNWLVHIGDGRRRKLDSRAAVPDYAFSHQRTVYARWMLEGYLRENPAEQGNVARVDLFRARVAHVGGGDVPRLEGFDYMFIYPELDAKRWPAGVGTSMARPLP
ncbi:MAG: hypothetical protein IPK87_03350 [Planctomycetes bacterium]|nr:hypothetical protein [Planctomycetota bacterium]